MVLPRKVRPACLLQCLGVACLEDFVQSRQGGSTGTWRGEKESRGRWQEKEGGGEKGSRGSPTAVYVPVYAHERAAQDNEALQNSKRGRWHGAVHHG
jgi:hypothetical protein